MLVIFVNFPNPSLCGLFPTLLSKDFILAVLLTAYVVHIEEAWESLVFGCHGLTLLKKKQITFMQFMTFPGRISSG